MAWIDPQQLTDEQLEAEINALEPTTIEFGRLNRRRWELIHEMGVRRQHAQRKAELAQIEESKA
jgi:hypothetical protein